MHSDKLNEELRILREENGRLKALLSDICPHDLQSDNTAEINNEQWLLINKMKSLSFLINYAAHEINNPNSSININIVLLEKFWGDLKLYFHEKIKNTSGFKLRNIPEDKLEKNIDDLILGIKNGSERIKKVIYALQTYMGNNSSKIESIFDLHAAIGNVTTLLRPQMIKATDSFEIERKCKELYVKGIQQKIEQAILNIIQNACEALTSRKQSIKLETSTDAKSKLAIIKVIDNGVGIKPQHLNCVTNLFFTTKQKAGGIGLGLSTALSILKDHKGNLNFTSKPGKGTTVKITLPLAREEEL